MTIETLGDALRDMQRVRDAARELGIKAEHGVAQ